MIEKGFLQDETNSISQGFLTVIFDIVSINQDLTTIKFIKAHKEVDDRGFTRTSMANKGDGFPIFNLKGNIF